MEKQELKGKIVEVIGEMQMGSVATIKEGKPWVRYMMMAPDDDLNLYAATFTQSRKVAQIQADNNVHVTMGGDPQNLEAPYINIQGTAEVLTDLETKQKCWSEMLAKFFKGPEDPDYSVVKVTPQLVEYWTAGSIQPDVYEVGG